MIWIFLMTALIGTISFWDDYRNLPTGIRLAAQSLCILGVLLGGGIHLSKTSLPIIGTISFGRLSMPVTFLFILWMTNLYNFMDGMDGLAGGMSLIGFGFLTWAAVAVGNFEIALPACLIVGASAGFLYFNKPPARIFMGDVGSVPLGFLAATLMTWGIQNGIFDLGAPLLVFSPFIVDATATLLRRLLRGKRIWQAHREHFYQRLVLGGWSQRKTLLAEYLLMALCTASGLLYIQSDEISKVSLLISWLVIYVILGSVINRSFEAVKA